MKMHDIMKKNDTELQSELQHITTELQALRFSASMSTLKAVRKIRTLRKHRARVLTALTQRNVN